MIYKQYKVIGRRVGEGVLLLLRLENEKLEYMRVQSQILLNQLELNMSLAHCTGKIAELQNKKKSQSKREAFQKYNDDRKMPSVQVSGEGMMNGRQLNNKRGIFIPKGEKLLWIMTLQLKQLTGLASQDTIDTSE
ncbi:hypothetical protein [Desulfogranum marinum]|uniref:hypothetical protein n=1 Tax=Desulfogranum marinum TaxID=453220 RepID=UPI0019666CA1|nr:hypothetical protein [Desulfogranum marinum]MBM9510891.1 hypothetical protein [Desulfogranum marinum]